MCPCTITNMPNALVKVSTHTNPNKMHPNLISDSLLVLQTVIHNTAKVLSN